MDKQSIQDLVSNYSIETTAVQAKHIGRFQDIVTPGTRIYIPHTPRSNFDETVALAVRLRRDGMEPVPHLVARRIEKISVLDDLLARLTGEAAVAQVLVVAGDIPASPGGIASALEILESGIFEKYRIRKIGVAGHPEGHPSVADPALRDALRRKNAYAETTGARVYIVTQFTFSADPVIRWEETHGADIGRLPVTVGLPGLASVRTLLKYAAECGVGPSLRAFSKRYSSLTKLLTVSTPDTSIVAVARHRAASAQSRISGIHFFTFGGFEKTAQWANRIVEGRFDLTEDDGLNVY